MFKSVSRSNFHDAFKNYSREDQFSYAGLDALYEYLEEYEFETGVKIELDVVALCCEYTEYDSLEDFRNSYTNKYTMEDIRNSTTVIMVDDESFIIQDF